MAPRPSWSLQQNRLWVAGHRSSWCDPAASGLASASHSTCSGGRRAPWTGIMLVFDDAGASHLVVEPLFRSSGSSRLSRLRHLKALGLHVQEWFGDPGMLALLGFLDTGLGTLQCRL